MENIIRQLHPTEYAEKLRSRKILYEQENFATDDNSRENIPTVFLSGVKIYPNQQLNIILKPSPFLNTITFSASSDRIIVISPEQNSSISFLVEILNFGQIEHQINQGQPSDNYLLTVKCLKRFKIDPNTFRNVNENPVTG